MTTWLLSDPHFGHKLIAAGRGFETAEAHDQVLLANLRSHLQEGDSIWWLGDISFGDWRRALADIKALPGTHHLIYALHDLLAPEQERPEGYLAAFQDTFASIARSAKLAYQGQDFLVCHYPYETSRGKNAAVEDGERQGWDQRVDDWQLHDEGIPLIHGHTHSLLRLVISAQGTPQVNVNPEAWAMQPVRLEEVAQVLEDYRHRQL